MIPGGGPRPPPRTLGHQSPVLNLQAYQPGDHVGVALRELMKRHQVTQVEMAHLTGNSTKHINQVLSTTVPPNPLLLWKMARVLYEEPRLAAHVFRVLQRLQGEHVTQKTLDEYGNWTPEGGKP